MSRWHQSHLLHGLVAKAHCITQTFSDTVSKYRHLSFFNLYAARQKTFIGKVTAPKMFQFSLRFILCSLVGMKVDKYTHVFFMCS